MEIKYTQTGKKYILLENNWKKTKHEKRKQSNDITDNIHVNLK